ncbi:MAG: ShlB/FhaC/HecB family hemolysin secretion/activation protein [Pleurocapsa sp.]
MKNFLNLLETASLTTLSVALLIVVSGRSLKAETETKTILYLAQLPPNSPDLPSAPLPPEESPPRITPLPPIEDFLESVPESPSEGTIPDSTQTFKVEKFEIKGNTVLPEADVQAVLKSYLNRELTFGDLLEIESKLTRLYAEAGYINSGFVVPSQNVGRGTITVQALEGTLEDITVNVNGRLKESYVRSRLGRGTKTPFNINDLQEALQLLQLDPLIENLNAELAVGSRRDRWLLDVDVNQANAFNPVLFINNSRTPSVGSFQRGLELNHDNLLGYGDRGSFVYKNTDGSNDLDTSYRFPFNSLNGTIGFRYRYVSSDIVEEPFDQLNIESETDQYQLTVRQPILVRASPDSTKELALGLEFSRQANSTTLDGEPFPLSAGAGESGDDLGETKISALRFFQDWTRRTRKDVFAARSQFSLGLDIFDATVNEDAPDSKFFGWRGQVQWLRQLNAANNINLLIRSDLQLSPDELVPLEQFSLGGIDSVRGYRQDSLLGDNGLFISAEVRYPFYRWNNGQNSLSIIPFVDFGTTWSKQENPNQEEDTIASIGLGLQLALSDALRARLDYGIPFVTVEDQDNTLQEAGVYFSVEYFPF